MRTSISGQRSAVICLLSVLCGLLTAFLAGAQTVDVVLTNGLVEPHSLVADTNNGTLYITDQGGFSFLGQASANRIMKFAPSTFALSVLAGDPAGVNGTNGNTTPNNGTLARFFNPAGIVLARGGLVVADSGNHLIRFVGFDGVVSNIAGMTGVATNLNGSGPAAGFNTPVGLAVDSAGNLYVADSKNNVIRKIDSTDAVTTYATNFNQPNGVAVGDNGDLWVADTLNHQIKVVRTNSPAGGIFTNVLVRAGTGTAGSLDTFPNAATAQLSSPRGVVWMGAAGLLISDSGNHTIRRLYTNSSLPEAYTIETSAGAPGAVGLVNGATNLARFNSPIGLARDVLNGAYLVAESGNKDIRRLQQTPALPPIVNPVIGVVTLVTNVTDTSTTITPVFTAVTDGVFNNDAVIAVTAAAQVQTIWSSGATPSDPFVDTVPAPSQGLTAYVVGSPQPTTLVSAKPDLTIKAQSIANGRISSGVVKARFQFVTATPQIAGNNPALFTVNTTTVGAKMYYTINGQDPTNGAGPNNLLVQSSTVNLGTLTNDVVFKVRAFKANYADSTTATTSFSPTNFTANLISFGFPSGEGSSQFIGAAGQTNYLPVVMSLLSGQKMYSLQFSLAVSNLTAPPLTNATLAFSSRLLEQLTPNPPAYRIIANQFVVGTSGTNLVTTNALFTNSVVTSTNNLIGVGWAETSLGSTNLLFDVSKQDLVKYSAVHNTVFDSANGQVIVGAFGFVIPTNGVTNGLTYKVNLLRPSATSDGIKDDVYIAVKGSQTVTIGSPAYLVGDAVPFRWFNAPDFGDTNLLANDVAQIFNAVAHPGFFNTPLPGSDFADAMDSCCGTFTALTNGLLLLSTNYTGSVLPGTDTNINFIAFGDGTLDVSDLFVTFRRSLDASLTNFMRFRSNGIQYAFATSNSFRGIVGQQTDTATTRKLRQIRSTQALAMETDTPPAVVFTAGEALAGGGQTLNIPITCRVSGDLPLRVLALSLNVIPLEDSPPLSLPLRFIPDASLGTPAMESYIGSSYGAAWLDGNIYGLTGDTNVGTLIVTIPLTAGTNAAYAIRFDHASASPTGVGTVPARREAGLITTRARTASSWGDGIPDAWRLKHFGTLNNLLSAPQADADGDGIPNWAEYRAGTDPNDASSGLKLRTPGLLSGGPRLRWPTMPGKTYVLEAATSIGATNWTAVATNVIGSGRDIEFQTPPAAGPRFYRVRLVEP